MAVDIGKIFEKELEKVFKQLKASHLLGWHRFVDSATAGGAFVAEQPSDYLVCLPGARVLYIEAKASEVHAHLQLAMIRPAQRGAINFYAGLLKVPYLIFFWDVENARLEMWEGPTALRRDRKKKPLVVWESISAGTKLKQERVADLLVKHFQIPAAAQTLRHYEESNP